MKLVTSKAVPLPKTLHIQDVVYVGIDPSMTSTGLAVIEDGELSAYRIKTEKKHGSDYARISYIWKTIKYVLAKHAVHGQSFVFCIEGYAMGAKGSRVFQLGELGGHLRMGILRRYKEPMIEVAPTSFKKFFTGSGTADKTVVMSTLKDVYDVAITDDDEADAAGLAITALKYDNRNELQLDKLEVHAMSSFSIIQRLPPSLL